MIPFRGVEGIKNLYLTKRCDICGKKMKYNGGTCSRCFVWFETNRYFLIAKYIRFSIRKYLYNEIPKPRAIPCGYELVREY